MKLIGTVTTASTMFLISSLLIPKTSIAAEFSTLECRKVNKNYVTVAVTTNGSATHLIIWKTREFSRVGYTPKRRCFEVTGKLRTVIANNGSMLSGLLLTTGRLDKYRVLCYVKNNRSDCNNNNFLFHISGKNAINPSQVITKLLNFSVTGSIDPIVE